MYLNLKTEGCFKDCYAVPYTGIAGTDGSTMPYSLFETQALDSNFPVVLWNPAFF